MKTGKLYFITGLHATGKTSIGKELYNLLKDGEKTTIRPHSSLGYKPPAPVIKWTNEHNSCENSLLSL